MPAAINLKTYSQKKFSHRFFPRRKESGIYKGEILCTKKSKIAAAQKKSPDKKMGSSGGSSSAGDFAIRLPVAAGSSQTPRSCAGSGPHGQARRPRDPFLARPHRDRNWKQDDGVPGRPQQGSANDDPEPKCSRPTRWPSRPQGEYGFKKAGAIEKKMMEGEASSTRP